MKTRIVLFTIAAVTLLSFSFVSGSNTEKKAIVAQEVTTNTSAQSGGIIIQDNTGW